MTASDTYTFILDTLDGSVWYSKGTPFFYTDVFRLALV